MIWKSEVAVVSAQVTEYGFAPSVNGDSGTAESESQMATTLPHQSDLSPGRYPFRVFMITINYLNYMVPLFFYAIRYAEVFWVSHKGFAFLFSAQLMMNSVHYALGFVGMSVMYKLSMYVHGQYNEMSNSPEMAEPSLLILAFLTMNITVFVSAVTFYLYGYTRYKLSESELETSEVDGPNGGKPWILRFNGLLPHAGAFVVFIILVLCKGFFIVEYIIVYRWLKVKDGRIFCCIFFDILFLLAWLFLWVMFTIKPKWKFGFFSHPSPYSNVDIPSDSDRDQGSSNSDTDLELNSGHRLNHFDGKRNMAHEVEAETSFGRAGNTSLLQEQFENQHNKALVEDQQDGKRNSIKYADEDSSVVMGNDSTFATPIKSLSQKNDNIEEIESPSTDGDRRGLMMEVSLDDDSPTVSSPMLPHQA